MLGLLVSKAARDEGAEWDMVSKVLAKLAHPGVDTWGSAAGLLGVKVPEGAFA